MFHITKNKLMRLFYTATCGQSWFFSQIMTGKLVYGFQKYMQILE